jgi:GT2 family glycosyltransferase
MQQIGFVVPTLGQRPDLIAKCLDSLLDAEVAQICVVTPEPDMVRALVGPEVASRLSILEESEKGKGAAKAINQGLEKLLSNSDLSYVSWLGDDDELYALDFKLAMRTFEQHPDSPMMVGASQYVDHEGVPLFIVKPRLWNLATLSFLPSRLPQPGCVFRSSALREAGLLNEGLTYAFDHELFIRIKKVGRVHLARRVVSRYMWHADGLSSSGLDRAVEEGHSVRMLHGAPHQQLVSTLHIVAYRLLRRFVSPKLH